MRIETIDLNFLGAEEIIASFLLLSDDSTARESRLRVVFGG
jgi:hypothetical protein